MIKYRLKESDDDEKPEPETTGGGGSNKEKIDYDIFLTPKGKSLDDVIKALKDIENYGTYVSNMRSKASVEDAIVKHFGPTVPVKKKQLEKEMGKPFPMKTKQAIDDLVKSLTSRPTLLSYHKEGDELVFPKNSNPSKDLTKKIIKVVLGNAGIGYSLKDKENLGEIDINDPILMQMRSKPKYNPLKMGNDKEKISYDEVINIIEMIARTHRAKKFGFMTEEDIESQVRLICIQQLFIINVATECYYKHNNQYTRGLLNLVLPD
jgi:hypothetical protein